MHNAIHMQAQCLARPVVPSKMLYSAPPSTRAFHRRIAGSQTARSRRTSSLVVHARMPRWDQMYPVLINKSLRSISPEEAQALQQNGAVLVDVRRGDIYGQGHVAGAVSIPMFQNLVCIYCRHWLLSATLTRTNTWSCIHRTGKSHQPARCSSLLHVRYVALHMCVILVLCIYTQGHTTYNTTAQANGVTPVEINPDFVAKVGALGAKTVVLMCEAGGTMEPSVNFKVC